MLGNPRLHLQVATSTNDIAKELGLKGAPHGTVVSAERQLKGRGRHNRGWWSREGEALTFSLLLRPGEGALLPLACAVGICAALPAPAWIKWPNDLYLARPDGTLGKVCGILIERRPRERFTVVGVGLNTGGSPAQAPAPLRARIATLGLAPSAREGLLCRILASLEEAVALRPDDLLARFRARDLLAGKQVRYRAGGGAVGEGRALGVGAEGELLVKGPGGVEALRAADVHLLYPPPSAASSSS